MFSRVTHIDLLSNLRTHIEISPFIKDIIVTTLTSILGVISAVIVTRLLAENLGPKDFGAYSISRRILGLVAPVTILGMDIALTRYIAIAKSEIERHHYFLCGLILGISPGIILLLLSSPSSSFLAETIYKDRKYSSLFMATMCLVACYAFYVVLYAQYRGSGNMKKANFLQLLIVVIGPLVIVSLFIDKIRVSFLVLILSMLFFCACIPIGLNVYRIAASGLIKKLNRHNFRELLEYGLPRLPAGFALAGLMGIGPFIAPHVGNLQDAGYLSAAQGVLLIVQSSVVAFGLVALPKVAQLAESGNQDFLRTTIGDTIAFLLHMGLFATLHCILWTDEIVRLLLGAKYLEVIPIMRVVLVSLMPYLGYVLLRSIVDAVEKRAYNTLNLFISLAVTIVLDVLVITVGAGTKGLAWGTTIGFITLGFLTTHFLWDKYQISYKVLQLKEAILLNLILLLISYIFKHFIHIIDRPITYVCIFIFELILFSLFIFMLWKIKAPWIYTVKKRIFKEPLNI